ncbi:discoidin domain-containing protein [Pedobacter sp. MW01-1-1]|uniref:discoidin domain-containing protein n=1 Tax=Pedobacter sp. MW01-1-1 TaxID=3383027 RepID=UPI003FF028E6
MKKNNLILTGLVAACLLFASSCQKADMLQDSLALSENSSTLETLTTGDSIITHTRNVNVVYFIPSDVDSVPGYKQRLSDLLLWSQDWVKQEMTRNGYSNKTFGLDNDGTGKVKIITIMGALPKSSYPYSGGSGAVASEVNAYFASHPTEKTSDHYLIILPRYSIGTNGSPSGGPFYGTGKWCYALDYEEMDIANMGRTDAVGNRFSVWFGGMVHELGHGLNLPHNRQKVSENSTLGMALMWAGNGTLGKSPTFLTAADAAILNANQVFNNNTNTFYGAVTTNITKIFANYDASSASIILSGKFTSTGNVNSILYYNDPNVNNEGTGGNTDYNAITWESKKIGTDSFYVAMPIADLVEKGNGMLYQLKVKFVHDNGTVTQQIYNYTFSGGLPVLTFSTKIELSKANWSIDSFSSQESTDGKATSLIDGNATTVWHSRWRTSAASYPHSVVIKVGTSAITANGLSLLQRSSLSRSVKDFEILTSNDGINFSTQGDFVAANNSGIQYFNFPSAQTFQYFKIIAKSAHDGAQFACLAELGLY